jgi:Sulfotransferase domain
MKKPNLFIAGHPRSGTSSLHNYLNQHSEIFMTAIKEPNYFARDFHEESDNFHKKKLYLPYRTEKQYLRLYSKWNNEKIAGEASWTNLYSKVAAKGIYDFNQQAKIIIMFREPVDFLYSYHSAAIFALGEDCTEFKEALTIENERKIGKCLTKRVITPSWLYYSDFIKYAEQVNRFLSAFPVDQIKIIVFESFINEIQNVYKEILEFLNVDTEFIPEFNVINPNKILKWPRLKKYTLDSPYFRKILRLLFSNDKYAAMKKFYKDKIVTYQPRPPLDKPLRKALMTKFKGEVEKISELLKIDLIALWEYDNI